MLSTGFELTPAMREQLTEGDYDVLVKDSLNYADAADDHRRGLGIGVPAGALYSTVGDLAKLVALEMGFGPRQRVASRDAQAEGNCSGDVIPGTGLRLWTRVPGSTLGRHSCRRPPGNLSGYTSQIIYVTKRKYGVIVLRSAAGGQADAHRLAGRAYRKLRSMLPN